MESGSRRKDHVVIITSSWLGIVLTWDFFSCSLAQLSWTKTIQSSIGSVPAESLTFVTLRQKNEKCCLSHISCFGSPALLSFFVHNSFHKSKVYEQRFEMEPPPKGAIFDGPQCCPIVGEWQKFVMDKPSSSYGNIVADQTTF